jgi:RNA polymerase sigma-70 factor (ECF subfamily)
MRSAAAAINSGVRSATAGEGTATLYRTAAGDDKAASVGAIDAAAPGMVQAHHAPRMPADEPRPTAPSILDDISTRWSAVIDPSRFVTRYAAAILKYLGAVLRNADEAEEALQDFLLRVVQGSLAGADPDRGRFRHYLKQAVRNAAISRLRRRRREPAAEPEAAEVASLEVADRRWLDGWRECVLERAWRELESLQRRSPGNLGFTVLRAATDQPHSSGEQLAAAVARKLGRPLSHDAFRKQLSRARRVFAELVVQETAQTLERPTAEQVEDELSETGLMSLLKPYLPADWKTTTTFTGARP